MLSVRKITHGVVPFGAFRGVEVLNISMESSDFLEEEFKTLELISSYEGTPEDFEDSLYKELQDKLEIISENLFSKIINIVEEKDELKQTFMSALADPITTHFVISGSDVLKPIYAELVSSILDRIMIYSIQMQTTLNIAKPLTPIISIFAEPKYLNKKDIVGRFILPHAILNSNNVFDNLAISNFENSPTCAYIKLVESEKDLDEFITALNNSQTFLNDNPTRIYCVTNDEKLFPKIFDAKMRISTYDEGPIFLDMKNIFC